MSTGSTIGFVFFFIIAAIFIGGGLYYIFKDDDTKKNKPALNNKPVKGNTSADTFSLFKSIMDTASLAQGS